MEARTEGGRHAVDLTRGISATWWYTATAVLFFELVLGMVWAVIWRTVPESASEFILVGGAALVWVGATLPLLSAYRGRTEVAPLTTLRQLPALLIATACAVVLLAVTGSALWPTVMVAQSIALLNWPRGIRLRVVTLLTVALVCCWLVDARLLAPQLAAESAGWVASVYSVLLPAMSVTSLWWWDVLVALDRARTAEARLAATQERLRVATDVHDLQGHHLQVIALQLELAEKLMPRDPEMSLEQVRAARASVAEATQGTRDLAATFRAVPLGDELANARDLLKAAGIAVTLRLAPDDEPAPGLGSASRSDSVPLFHGAPASVLGPIVRETTTNVLRHGGGGWANLSLDRVADGWRYTIENDRGASASERNDGAGLEGIRRRAGEVGGSVEVHRGGDVFALTVLIPAEVNR